ncbi:hypothetical protein PHMEG_0007910 [Phytophthora megakarya]|uniref:Uncharacterized protein n=1 Tax=Phytophthora megakarya TaxID=4795 RepID=A0A225WK02_9STRA|nr:hypothetical protein PHMEG_0007910 [Phytophthora megakarya]
MHYDRARDTYVPFFYNITGPIITCSSEFKCSATNAAGHPLLALQQAVRDRFPTAFIVGCIIHWKQRYVKMLALGIPRDQIRLVMETSSIGTLTVILEDKILFKGIPYVIHHLYGQMDRTGNKSIGTLTVILEDKILFKVSLT